MKPISGSDLFKRSKSELSGLFHQVSTTIDQAPSGSPQRRMLTGACKDIKHALNYREQQRSGPGL